MGSPQIHLQRHSVEGIKLSEKRRVHFEKITVEKKLDLAECKIRDMQKQLSEAHECLNNYAKPEQVGALANIAIEYFKKWGI